jgi:hypothetical protein
LRASDKREGIQGTENQSYLKFKLEKKNIKLMFGIPEIPVIPQYLL